MLTVVFFSFLLVLISHALSTNTLANPRRSMLDNLQHLVDTAFANETADDRLWLEELTRLLEEDEGFRLVEDADPHRRVFDGSGEMMDEEDLPPVYSNMSVIAFTLGTTPTAFAKYTPRTHPTCPCEKGERGEKGDAGICPADCASRLSATQKDCLDSRINLQRLAQSIRQLILDTKKIAYRNAQSTSSCACPVTIPASSTTTVSNQFTLDAQTSARLKGEKGDRGETGGACLSTQTNVRVFTTLQEAMDASVTYPDHTYVHIVDEQGRLQRVFIRVHGYLVPIRIEGESSLVVQVQPPTTLAIPKPRCTVALQCPQLHLFALGPYIRKMCHSRRSNTVCTTLADYDELCGRVAERHRLKGFYRAFMSTSNQWLSNLFADVCVTAQIVNMHEQILFDSYEDIFEEKTPQSEILDIEGLSPQFKYWWHGSFHNGTGSSDTCLDWARYDSRLSGRASRLPDRVHGIFHHQLTWPCSIGDSNMGMFCIETNCDKRNYYKH